MWTFPNLSNYYSTPISKEKNLDKIISKKVPDNLGKTYYLNYQKNSIQYNIKRKNNEERYIDNSKLRTNNFISHVINNETLPNIANKRSNNKKINEREPRHFSRIKEKQKDNNIHNNDNGKFNNNITLSVGKSSKPQNSKSPKKESILSLLKQTKSSVEILSNKMDTTVKTFSNKMDTTVQTFSNKMDKTFKNFGDKIDTTVKKFGDKIDGYMKSQDNINNNLLRILNKLIE